MCLSFNAVIYHLNVNILIIKQNINYYKQHSFYIVLI